MTVIKFVRPEPERTAIQDASRESFLLFLISNLADILAASRLDDNEFDRVMSQINELRDMGRRIRALTTGKDTALSSAQDAND